MSSHPVFCIVAGEPSGDLLGSFLMKSLKEIFPAAQFVGVGGPLMEACGLSTLFPIQELSVIGITEIIPKAWGILKKVSLVAKFVHEQKVDALITIDAPAFSFRVGRALRRLEKKSAEKTIHIHYVAPTVWAWRPKRSKKIAKFLTHLLTLFSFEPPYFLKEGLPATFVGHPVLQGQYDEGDEKRFRAEHLIPKTMPLICMLPGSRMSEVHRHLPVFLEALKKLYEKSPKFGVIIPTLGHLKEVLHKLLQKERLPFPVIVVEGEGQKRDAFAASRCALAASGTVALELSCAGLPMIIAYRTSALTAFIVRLMIKIPFVSMPNILLGRRVVPELIQEKCRADLLCDELKSLLGDVRIRNLQKEAFFEVKEKLSPSEDLSPSLFAAKTIQNIMKRKSS